MRAIWAVFKREIALYFRSPIAYAVAFAIYFFIGLLFAGNVIQAVQINTDPQFGGGNIPATVLLNATQLITFLMFLIGPLLTMRLIAEENREGTLEVLMTLPMNESAFIIGKFLAVWAYYTVLLLFTLVQVLLLNMIGILDFGIVFTTYLGAWLYGGAVLAICMIWSAITEDQVIAAFLGAATVLVLYLSELGAIYVDNLTQASTSPAALRAGGVISGFIREIGLNGHYQTALVQGLIRAQDIAYFIFMIVAALFITTRIVETRRWRG
jgi:ABC-2 type transport system permease protein